MPYLQTAVDVGKDLLYKGGALTVGSGSVVAGTMGLGAGLYGASKIGLEEMADIADGAAASYDRIDSYLDGEDADDDLHEFPDPREESLSNIYSAAKWSAGGLVLGGIGALGYSEARSWW